MIPYLGYGVGDFSDGRATVAVFFIQAKTVEAALEILGKVAERQWEHPILESLTLLLPGRVPAEWLALFTGEETDGLIDYVVQPGTRLVDMVA